MKNLTVDAAWEAILATVQPGPVVRSPLAQALELNLAADIAATCDSPPFDKALMDGYAVRCEDVQSGFNVLTVIEEVTAGRVPQYPLKTGQATRIMTGAPLPANTSAVVPIEETQPGPTTDTVQITAVAVRAEQHLLRQGAITRTGQRVLAAGRPLRAQEIAALAESGFDPVPVRRRPRIAILATGDELVPAQQPLGPGQIRNSNEPMLVAQMRQAGAEAVGLGIARDQREDLRRHILAGLACDFLLLSGGVSAGKLDLVPSELQAAGVREVFHKIQMKPGKPLWFGVREAPDSAPCYVFGLPGNPVSSMVCAELFVRTALRRWNGDPSPAPRPIRACLTQPFSMRGPRPTYHPAQFNYQEMRATVQAVDWIGSADIIATVDANAVALFPPGDRDWQPGEEVDVFPW